MSVCFHTSIVAISNSLNIKFESALFQFHWERKREGGGIEALFLLLAILVSCGCGRCISDYNLISDHYKVTTGLGCWWRSEAAGCGLSRRMRGSWEDTASANGSRVLLISDQSEARDTERERTELGPETGHWTSERPPATRGETSVSDGELWVNSYVTTSLCRQEQRTLPFTQLPHQDRFPLSVKIVRSHRLLICQNCFTVVLCVADWLLRDT